MPVHIRFDGDVVILSNFGRLMDDPRHFDASRDVRELLDQGYRKFILELRAVGELGTSGLGLLMTITRLARQHRGEVVLAQPSRGMKRLIDEMRLDDYWETYGSVREAQDSLSRSPL